jgi:hypothetical protein
MPKSSKLKAKFSLRNFLILFIAIGILVAMSFWAGRMSKTASAASAPWWDVVSWYAGRVPSGHYTGEPQSATWCVYTAPNVRWSSFVEVTHRSDTTLYTVSIVSDKVGPSKLTTSNLQSAGYKVRDYCNWLHQ